MFLLTRLTFFLMLVKFSFSVPFGSVDFFPNFLKYRLHLVKDKHKHLVFKQDSQELKYETLFFDFLILSL